MRPAGLTFPQADWQVWLWRIGGGSLVFVMAACADPNTHADAITQTVHLARQEVSAGDFVLTSFYRITRPDQPLTIYIEGDGLAWPGATGVSPPMIRHRAWRSV